MDEIKSTLLFRSLTRLLLCRRTLVALVAIGCLTRIGLTTSTDVAAAIAAVAIGLAGSNAAQAAYTSRGKT